MRAFFTLCDSAQHTGRSAVPVAEATPSSKTRVSITLVLALTVGASLFANRAQAQSTVNLAVLQGLAPVSVLLNTSAGQAALASNYAVTGAIQNGTANQPALQPLPLQREQAVKDAFITSGNASELADGLGTKLGAAYQSLASYTSTDDGKTSTFTSVSPNVAVLLAYASGLTAADSAAGKYFFANGTTNGTTPVSSDAEQILTNGSSTTDIFGKAYHHPAGTQGADPYGDSRPFQTEAQVATYSAADYFGVASKNTEYLYGPIQRLVESPSFPSGHTTYGYTESLLLGMLVPERFAQMIVRGAEYGNSRIVLGAHYAMDVLAGRTLAYYDVAQLLAQRPGYVGQTIGKVTITDFQATLRAARADLSDALAVSCGSTLAVCASQDTSRFRDAAATRAFYESTQTYGLPVVYEATARKVEDVAGIAPEAGFILRAAFPNLTLGQADQILTDTEGPGGGFLDNGSAFGIYSRLDLYDAAQRAARTR